MRARSFVRRLLKNQTVWEGARSGMLMLQVWTWQVRATAGQGEGQGGQVPTGPRAKVMGTGGQVVQHTVRSERRVLLAKETSIPG